MEHTRTRNVGFGDISAISLGQGALAGLIGGIVLAMFAMIVAWAAGDGLWSPPRAITGMFGGAEYAGSGFAFGSIAVGVMLHMMLSMVFGVIYAFAIDAITHGLGAPVQLVTGMVYGVFIWAINTYLIGPRMPGDQLMTDAMPAWAWFVGHVMFGAVLGYLYAYWRTRETLAPVA